MSLSPFSFDRRNEGRDTDRRGRPSWATHEVRKLLGSAWVRMGWAASQERAERMAAAVGGTVEIRT